MSSSRHTFTQRKVMHSLQSIDLSLQAIAFAPFRRDDASNLSMHRLLELHLMRGAIRGHQRHLELHLMRGAIGVDRLLELHLPVCT